MAGKTGSSTRTRSARCCAYQSTAARRARCSDRTRCRARCATSRTSPRSASWRARASSASARSPTAVFDRVGPPRRRVCHDRWRARTRGPGRNPRRTDGRCPATRRHPVRGRKLMPGGGRPYAVVRRTRRRAGAVRGAAVPAAGGRRRAGATCACCARYSTSWSPASSSSCSWMML